MYDYAFLGGGLASLELANLLVMQQAKILIIERDRNKKNDRTWCIWHAGEHHHDDIVRKTWDTGGFFSMGGEECFRPMGSYSYRQIRSSAYYDKMLTRLNAYSGFTMEFADVEAVEEKSDGVIIRTSNGEHEAGLVFDSRIDFRKYTPPATDGYNYATQHFYGYFLTTTQPSFDDSGFTLMDFSYPGYKNEFAFVYILPDSPTTALVELTFFSNKLREEDEYRKMLELYIESKIAGEYKIEEIEQNKIPMLDRVVERHQNGRVLNIGTNGGLTKVSTGYTFSKVMKDSRRIADFLAGRSAGNRGESRPQSFKGFPRYSKVPLHDRIILAVMLNEPDVAMQLFYKLFTTMESDDFYAFLDDGLGPLKSLSVYSKAPIPKFLGYAIKTMLSSNR